MNTGTHVIVLFRTCKRSTFYYFKKWYFLGFSHYLAFPCLKTYLPLSHQLPLSGWSCFDQSTSSGSDGLGRLQNLLLEVQALVCFLFYERKRETICQHLRCMAFSNRSRLYWNIQMSTGKHLSAGGRGAQGRSTPWPQAEVNNLCEILCLSENVCWPWVWFWASAAPVSWQQLQWPRPLPAARSLQWQWGPRGPPTRCLQHTTTANAQFRKVLTSDLMLSLPRVLQARTWLTTNVGPPKYVPFQSANWSLYKITQ